jgi:hypothetical protein
MEWRMNKPAGISFENTATAPSRPIQYGVNAALQALTHASELFDQGQSKSYQKA